MTISDRFVLFLRGMGLSQKIFCAQTGYLPQSLSKFITGRTKLPKLDFIEAILIHYPELSIRWLILGEGPVFRAKYSYQIGEENLLKTLEKAPPSDEEKELARLDQLNIQLRIQLEELRRQISLQEKTINSQEKTISLLEWKLQDGEEKHKA